MDCYSDHSAILDYLAEVEHEKQLRETLKSKSGIAALRVERGESARHAPAVLAGIVGGVATIDLHKQRGVCPWRALQLYTVGI